MVSFFLVFISFLCWCIQNEKFQMLCSCYTPAKLTVCWFNVIKDKTNLISAATGHLCSNFTALRGTQQIASFMQKPLLFAKLCAIILLNSNIIHICDWTCGWWNRCSSTDTQHALEGLLFFIFTWWLVYCTLCSANNTLFVLYMLLHRT